MNSQTVDDDGAGPPIQDLASSPWSTNPVLVDSAWKRVRGREWKWAILSGKDPVKVDRKLAGLLLVKFTKEYQIVKAAWDKDHPKQPRKKRQRKVTREVKP